MRAGLLGCPTHREASGRLGAWAGLVPAREPESLISRTDEALKPERDSPVPSYFPQMMRMAAVGTELVGWVLFPTLIGYWIDHRWGTGPVAVILCGLFGIIGGLAMVIRRGTQINAELQRRSETDSERSDSERSDSER